MKKLYKATYEQNVVFFSEQEDNSKLNSEARKWVKIEEETNSTGLLNVSEIKSMDDVPTGWEFDSIPWGSGHGPFAGAYGGAYGDDETIEAWFSHQNERIEKLEKIENLKAEIAKLNRELNG